MNTVKRNSYRIAAIVFILSTINTPMPARGQGTNVKKQPAVVRNAGPQKVIKEGVAIELTVDPLSPPDEKSRELREGEDAVVRIKVTDTGTNSPVTNLHPVAWMDRRQKDEPSEIELCKKKVQSFLQGSLRGRPDIDLNTYFLLVLNRDPTISVIDPLLGYGGSKLLAMAFLRSPGEDWALTKDKRKLFVTMPLVNQVAVIDTSTWKVVANIDVGVRPTRVALQPDEKYLWVGNDGINRAADQSGVTVIDSAELKAKATIMTGAGHHDMAFTPDDRYAFVTNRQGGTLSVIDVQKLEKTREIKVGSLPSSVAFSALSKAVYVANEGDGTITVVDGDRHEVLKHMAVKQGIRTIRFAPGGRWGFVVNSKEGVVDIVDSSNNTIQQTVEVGKEPDHVAFTQSFAYVRSIGSDLVKLINLESIAKGDKAATAQFSGGQIPVGTASNTATASAIVPAPEGNTVLVANTSDKQVYYYMEGMAAPMGSFQTYKREPKAVMVVDKSLRETSPGVYSTSVKLTGAGSYDVAFLLNTPRVTHCFDLSVKSNPAVKNANERMALRVEPLFKASPIKVREKIELRFRLTDPETKQPKDGLKDVNVLTLLAPGQWHTRQWARSLGDGVYEVSFAPPESGVYYVFLECASLKVRYNHLPYSILQAVDRESSK
jgi:YVTN family beta-propeller protein